MQTLFHLVDKTDITPLLDTAYPLKALRERLGSAYTSFVQYQQLVKLDQAFGTWSVMGNSSSLESILELVWQITHPKHEPDTPTEVAKKALQYIPRILKTCLTAGERIPYPVCHSICITITDRELWQYISTSVEEKYLLACLSLDMAKGSAKHTDNEWTSTLEQFLSSWTGETFRHKSNLMFDVASRIFGPAWACLYEEELLHEESSMGLLNITVPSFADTSVPHSTRVTKHPSLPLDLTL